MYPTKKRETSRWMAWSSGHFFRIQKNNPQCDVTIAQANSQSRLGVFLKSSPILLHARVLAIGLKTSHRKVVNISSVLYDCIINSEGLQRGKAEGHALKYVIIRKRCGLQDYCRGPRLISLVVIDGIRYSILLTMNFFPFYSYIYKRSQKGQVE